LFRDDLLHPAGVKVNKVAGTTTNIGQVFDGQTQPPRAGSADHKPVMVGGKMFVGDLIRKLLVIDLVIIPANALLRHASCAAGLKDFERTVFEFYWTPDVPLEVAQPFVLKMGEPVYVGQGLNLLARVPTGFFRPI